MKITLAPTQLVVSLVASDGVSARVWQGTTDQGTPVHAYITILANPPTPEADKEVRLGLEAAEFADAEIVGCLGEAGIDLNFDGEIVSISPETGGALQ